MKFEDKNVLVVGMARSGIAAAALLLRQKAKVFLYDAKPIETFDGLLDKLIEHGAVPYLGKDAPVEEMDCLVLSLSLIHISCWKFSTRRSTPPLWIIILILSSIYPR